MTVKRKYKNEPVVVDGIRFDSKIEAKRYEYLKLLQAAGHIDDLECHPVYELQGRYGRSNRQYRAISYKPDFRYRVGEKIVSEDVKGGILTEAYKLKIKLLLFKFPELSHREVYWKKNQWVIHVA
jgi:hypothetical protein